LKRSFDYRVAVVFDRLQPGRKLTRSRAHQQVRNVMARMIRHEKNLPYEIPEGTELPIYICGCGLSKNKPFCDGSHKRTADETANEVYAYDEKSRIQVKNQY
jgi:CDGSH-type Zn-finger protein